MNRRNTPRGQMSMGKGGPAIQMMEGAMRAMFEPPPPLEFKKSVCKRKPPKVEGVAAMLKGKGANNLFEEGAPPPPEKFETPRQRHARIAAAKKKTDEEGLKDDISKWNPKDDPKAKGDAYKTLFIAKISYDTTEKKLRREFEQFGRIQSIRMVQDEDGKPRGYAFVEYENEDDMRVAYKRGDGRKIDGRRVLVDVERGRTVRNWLPRRFGGGLGDSRKERPKKGHEAEWRERERLAAEAKEAEKEAKREKERQEERARRDREREEREKSRPAGKDGDGGDGKRSDSRERGRRGDSRDRSRSRDGSRDRRRRSRSRDRRR
ncbi:unnamed protein product [Ectocarpus sp. 4 AP-2014]